MLGGLRNKSISKVTGKRRIKTDLLGHQQTEGRLKGRLLDLIQAPTVSMYEDSAGAGLKLEDSGDFGG